MVTERFRSTSDGPLRGHHQWPVGGPSSRRLASFFRGAFGQACVISAFRSAAQPVLGDLKMVKLEQLASTHESISDLLHEIDPRVLIAMACAAADLAVPELVKIRYRNPRIEVPWMSKPARPYAVDLIYTTLTADGERQGWLFEVELSFNLIKIRRWAYYEIT
ncbi:MAG TPA: hypothetical protein VK034_26125, partial [Enhygromyxa sp.]|nr:hypothetical protein [Enhygromyxa sp.]